MSSFLQPRNMILSLMLQSNQNLQQSLEDFSLSQSHVIHNADEEIGYLYFPNNGLISVVFTTEEGSILELGIIGNEGVSGISTLLSGQTSPFQSVIQMSGNFTRMPFAIAQEEFNHCKLFHQLVLSYTNKLLIQSSFLTVCNRFHTVYIRLVRWLLMVQDRTQQTELKLTQEFISYMLGTDRSEVTIAAKMLQQAGFIHYKRGLITIVDRGGMEQVACECYHATKAIYNSLPIKP